MNEWILWERNEWMNEFYERKWMNEEWMNEFYEREMNEWRMNEWWNELLK